MATGGGLATGGGSTSAGGGSAGGGGAVAPTPQELRALSAGTDFTCAVLADKTAKCWGAGGSGQLGNGQMTRRARPVAVTGLTGAVAISAGYAHACAAKDDGTAVCWGNDDYGQLGNGVTGTSSAVPVVVSGLSGVVAVHAGVNSSCAVLGDGTVSCWGKGIDLGDANLLTNSNVPRAVPGLTQVAQLSMANSVNNAELHVCGVRSDHTAFCWGGGLEGQLGQGDGSTKYDDQRVPTPVVGLTDVLQITAGGTHACARRTAGLSCWGFGQEVGNGSPSRVTSPVTITTTEPVTMVEAGGDFSLAVTASGAMLAWGFNGRGQCGTGLTSFPAATPVNLMPVPSLLAGATLLAAGDEHSCAYVASTKVTWCWGDDASGELGFDLTDDTRTDFPDFVRW